jgi:hypothetical protein
MLKPKKQIKISIAYDTGSCDLDNEYDQSHRANENGISMTIGQKTLFLCDRHAKQIQTQLNKIYNLI